MSIWLFGNTTVRSPFRLIGGLGVFATTNGAIKGSKEKELLFCKALVDAGIINASFNAEDNSGFSDTTYSVGRKWRSALEKLGFIEQRNDDSGVYVVTRNGQNLLDSKALQSDQECYLRALILYAYPALLSADADADGGVVGPGVNQRYFSPLILTLRIMKTLELQTGSSKITFQEMAAVVQLTFSYEKIEQAINEILLIRANRLASNRKKQFDRELYASKRLLAKVQAATIKDYADTNIRYLKATGLFTALGKGIGFIESQRLVIDKLLETYDGFDVGQSEFDIRVGAPLPTDDIETNCLLISELERDLNNRNVWFDKNVPNQAQVGSLKNYRYYLENIVFKDAEGQFASNQKNEWVEILAYMDILISTKSLTLEIDDKEISIPSGEKPAYFEWVLWRAFLAMNHLVVDPHQCRRFKVDQDFKPIHNAPGGGADVIFEYDDFKILGEVTLTSNSRQEAAEGEPVRRHVAVETVDTPDKQVYGLFLAVSIDTNTAETFRHGAWYHKEQLVDVKILPLTLLSFKNYLQNLIDTNQMENGIFSLKAMMDEALILRGSLTAPEWKSQIATQFATHHVEES